MSKRVCLKRIIDEAKEAMGVWGKAPSRWEIFCNFFEKTSYLNAIGSQFARFYNHFKELDF